MVESQGGILICIEAGVSDTVEPELPSIGDTVVDGTVEWERLA